MKKENSVDNFEHVTTDAKVEIYEGAHLVFSGLIKEIRELSKKKPDSTMSKFQVKNINRVLDQILLTIVDEPEHQHCDRIDDADLPKLSDAVIVMVQFEAAMDSFLSRYKIRLPHNSHQTWITEEYLGANGEDEGEDEPDEA